MSTAAGSGAVSSEGAVTPANARASSPFSRGSVLAILLIGFGAFIAMLYFLGVGDTGGDRGSGRAHASSNALHGYAGLTDLLEANGYTVTKSLERSGYQTSQLLVLTPTQSTDAEEFAKILEDRQYYGPTLVILPKWFVTRPRGEIADEDKERVKDDWVRLVSTTTPQWTQELPEPYALTVEADTPESEEKQRWAGLGISGELPSFSGLHAEAASGHEALVIDPSGRRLAVNVIGEEGSYFYEEAHFLTFVIEPDLMNNYGLADPARAALALAIVEQSSYDDKNITFDMTLVGFGGTTNLLTLAFQPPFLAATLCLIIAMLIVGWRAFLRFGPVAAKANEGSFGKTQLVSNGAGLIMRAGRLQLLGEPYIALTQRKLASALGLTHADAEAIDESLAQRLPDEEPFSNRAARLQSARSTADVVRAAQSLNDLVSKTTGKSTR